MYECTYERVVAQTSPLSAKNRAPGAQVTAEASSVRRSPTGVCLRDCEHVSCREGPGSAELEVRRHVCVSGSNWVAGLLERVGWIQASNGTGTLLHGAG
jgi:hypothetical protein